MDNPVCVIFSSLVTKKPRLWIGIIHSTIGTLSGINATFDGIEITNPKGEIQTNEDWAQDIIRNGLNPNNAEIVSTETTKYITSAFYIAQLNAAVQSKTTEFLKSYKTQLPPTLPPPPEKKPNYWGRNKQ